MKRTDFMQLERIGITGFPRKWMTNKIKNDVAMDADLVTAPNNGVPAWMTNYTHEEVIRVLTSKRAAENIFDPLRKGAYGTMTATFPMIEYTGDVTPYSDGNSDGYSGYNANYPTRDCYYFQTVTDWGDMESAVMGYAKIDSAAEKQASMMDTMKKAHNKFWFYGVAGLDNYGILNDPNLPPSITPNTGTGGLKWDTKTANEIYADILKLFIQLNKQAGGTLKDGFEMSDPLKLCLSNMVAPHLKKQNDHGITVASMVKDAFPNLEVETAPEYSTPSGELVQLTAPAVGAQRTGSLGYTEIVKVHGVVRELSSFKEKNSGGTFGAVIAQPFAVASMLGV